MANDKPSTPVEAAVAPPTAPIPIAPLDERMAAQKTALLDMQKQLQMQLNGVANQLFLIDQLENPGMTPGGDEGNIEEPRDDPPGTM